MPPPRPARKESASVALARVAPQVSRWVERLLAEQDPSLTVAQYLALEELDHGNVGAAELARGTGVSRSAVSQLISSLADGGLVERAEAADDRRRQALRLSAEGKRVLRAARGLLRKRLDPLLAELPHPEADALARSLGRVEALLGGTAPPRRVRPLHPRGPRP
jgi:DNA-binding MarR family transcriptional regulator